MSDFIKVEIKNLDTGEWQWMGKMTPFMLKLLCMLADRLSDAGEEGST